MRPCAVPGWNDEEDGWLPSGARPPEEVPAEPGLFMPAKPESAAGRRSDPSTRIVGHEWDPSPLACPADGDDRVNTAWAWSWITRCSSAGASWPPPWLRSVDGGCRSCLVVADEQLGAGSAAPNARLSRNGRRFAARAGSRHRWPFVLPHALAFIHRRREAGRARLLQEGPYWREAQLLSRRQWNSCRRPAEDDVRRDAPRRRLVDAAAVGRGHIRIRTRGLVRCRPQSPTARPAHLIARRPHSLRS
jgi:hypothetical protein